VALRQFTLQRLAQVLHLFLLDEEVGVARHAELVAAIHLHAGEELAHVRVDDRGEEDEVVRAVRDLGRELDYRAAARAAPARSPCASRARRRRVPESSIAKLRLLLSTRGNGCAGIEPDRREERHHLALEVIRDPFLLRGVPRRAPQEADLLLVERGRISSLKSRYCRSTIPCARAATWRNTWTGREALGPHGGGAELDLLLEARDADLEELVEVGGDDAEEAQALEERHRAVLACARTRRLNSRV
jgi:hypothetical protein